MWTTFAGMFFKNLYRYIFLKLISIKRIRNNFWHICEIFSTRDPLAANSKDSLLELSVLGAFRILSDDGEYKNLCLIKMMNHLVNFRSALLVRASGKYPDEGEKGKVLPISCWVRTRPLESYLYPNFNDNFCGLNLEINGGSWIWRPHL